MKRIYFYFRKFKRTEKSCSLAMRDNSCLSLRVNENVEAENGPYGWTEFLCIQWFKHRGYKQWRYKQRVVRKFDDKKVNDFKIKLNTNSIDCRVLEGYFRPKCRFLIRINTGHQLNRSYNAWIILEFTNFIYPCSFCTFLKVNTNIHVTK